MTRNYYWAIVTAVAFVAGTLVSGTAVEAISPDLEIYLSEILGIVQDLQSNSESNAPLTQILTIDKQGFNTIAATSDSEFIVTFCSQNSDDSTADDYLSIARNGSVIIAFDINSDSAGDRCITVGGNAGDFIDAESSQNGSGVTSSTAVMQAKEGASASLS